MKRLSDVFVQYSQMNFFFVYMIPTLVFKFLYRDASSVEIKRNFVSGLLTPLLTSKLVKNRIIIFHLRLREVYVSELFIIHTK